MALSVLSQKNQTVMSALFSKVETGMRTSFSTATTSNSSGWQTYDAYSGTSSMASLKNTVMKMQSAIFSTSSLTLTKQDANLRIFRENNLELAQSVGTTINNSASFNVDLQSDGQNTQLTTNMQQAQEVMSKLGLNSNADWGIESMAQDLVFQLDFTSINRDPQELTQAIKDKSLELLTELDTNFTGTDDEREARRRQITGASSRLVNGLTKAGGAITTMNVTANAKTTVTVGGVEVNASAIVAVGNVIVDPLVLDLKGDGINLKGYEEGVEFDMNGDGEKTNMGFIRGDDALLFIDEHGDGIVHDGKQLFGNADGYANGFEKLAAYDSNNDGVIDELDEIWESLRVWVEKTEDGICEADETMSLSEAGIKSINVGYQNVREDDGKGNLIGQVGNFTRSDGSTGLAADAWLQEGQKPKDHNPAPAKP